jgi:hypothetical protein
MTQHVLRGLRIVAGVALMACGAVLAVPMVPGPGILLLLGGLALLGQEFHWARRMNLWLRRQGRRMVGRRNGR